MATPQQKTRLSVQVVCLTISPPFTKQMLVPMGQTVGWCVNASGIYGLHPQLRGGNLGVWNTPARPDVLAQEGDRIEVYTAVLPEAITAARQKS
jgi:putative ubiquitin-RnfH superfamily antitoxin RatB of RatAB toxin-antitoxin module